MRRDLGTRVGLAHTQSPARCGKKYTILNFMSTAQPDPRSGEDFHDSNICGEHFPGVRVYGTSKSRPAIRYEML